MRKIKTPAEQLSIAIAMSARGHEQQLDKGGAPYILHPIRVMQRLRTDDYELMAIAVLHDYLEDVWKVSKKDDAIKFLHSMGLGSRVVQGCLALWHTKDPETISRYGEEDEYMNYIQFQVCANKDAMLVKLEDLRDNSDLTRLKGLRSKDFERMKKYQKAFAFIKKEIEDFDNRNPENEP